MFEDIHEIAENSAYLKAVEQKRSVSLEMLDAAASLQRVSRHRGAAAGGGECADVRGPSSTRPPASTVDQAVPHRRLRRGQGHLHEDVEAYKSMRFESARRKVAALLYQRFVARRRSRPTTSTARACSRSSSRARGRREEGAGRQSAAGQHQPVASPSHGQTLDLKTMIPPSSPLPSANAASSIGSALPATAVVNGHIVRLSGNAGPVSSPRANGLLSVASPRPHPSRPSALVCGVPHAGSIAAPPITPSSPSNAASTLLQMGTRNNTIGVYGKSVRVVREKVHRGGAQDLFDEVARDVMTDLKLDAFPASSRATSTSATSAPSGSRRSGCRSRTSPPSACSDEEASEPCTRAGRRTAARSTP